MKKVFTILTSLLLTAVLFAQNTMLPKYGTNKSIIYIEDSEFNLKITQCNEKALDIRKDKDTPYVLIPANVPLNLEIEGAKKTKKKDVIPGKQEKNIFNFSFTSDTISFHTNSSIYSIKTDIQPLADNTEYVLTAEDGTIYIKNRKTAQVVFKNKLE